MTAQELWHEYCSEMKIDEATHYEAWSFGDGAIWGDELLGLVLRGRKFGIASAYDEYVAEDALEELPKIGDYSILLRANGETACVIRNYDVYIRPFGSVPPFQAYAEGEADRSLESWKEIHTKFFCSRLEAIDKTLNAESLIVCEKFTVEYVVENGSVHREELFFAEPSMTYAEEISSYGARGTVLLCVRKADNKMIGCMQVHHVLNEQMRTITGHVGYSVRPSERRKIVENCGVSEKDCRSFTFAECLFLPEFNSL